MADPLPLEPIEGSSEKVNKIKIQKKFFLGNHNVATILIMKKLQDNLANEKMAI